MEESKALHRLGEAGDLVGMIEDLLNPSVVSRLSPAAWSGIRITLRSAREAINTSQSALASEFVSRARQNGANAAALNSSNAPSMEQPVSSVGAAPQSLPRGSNPAAAPVFGSGISDLQRGQLTRKDLRASLEKIIER